VSLLIAAEAEEISSVWIASDLVCKVELNI
jgi:hypothetical protein